jgi:photosystem II stability/assembly factor-like uncharacterized protein
MYYSTKMNFKSFLGCVTIAALAFGIAFITGEEKKVASYSKRTETKEGNFMESEWFMRRLRGNIQSGDYVPSDFLEVSAAVQAHDRNNTGNRAVNLAWWEMGPDNVGGRTRAILAATNDIIFAGSVTGGLYKSTNGGNNWARVTSLDAIQKTMAISCIDMTSDGTIYIGTGSTFESSFGGDGGSGAIGVGLYRSSDMGATWSVVPGTEPAAFSAGDDWAFINDLEADPNFPSRIWIVGNAGSGYFDGASNVLNMDVDGLPSSTGQSVVWAEDGSYALITGANGNIYKTIDDGLTFEDVSISAMSGQRSAVAISRSNPLHCYAIYTSGFMKGVFHSSDQGNTWSEIWPEGIDDSYSVFGTGQGVYDLALAVNPEDENKCWVGGVTLWQSGAQSSPVQIAYNFAFGGSENYVHSDIHTFEIAPNGDWYIGSDGGVSKSTDGGLTFSTLNRGYNVTQFYGIAHSAGYAVMGGAQDNGTQAILGMDNGFLPNVTDQQAIQITGGDGFHCDMSQNSMGSPLLFTSLYYGSIGRYNAQGSGGAFYDNEINNLTDPNATLGLGIGIFYTPVRLFENTQDENAQQFVLAVNPTNQTISDTTITLYTSNLGFPFEYTIGPDDELRFWDELIRPSFTHPTADFVDPEFFWLDPQTNYEVEDCDTTMVEVIETIAIYDTTSFLLTWIDTVYVPELNDTLFFENSELIITDIDTTFSDITVLEEVIDCQTVYFYEADTLVNVAERRLVQDTYSSLFVTAFTGTDGIWVTRQALNLNVTPDWWRVSDAPGSGVRAFEFSRDGNTMWYTSWSGGLWRITGFNNVWSVADISNLVITQVLSSSQIITDVAVDPTNDNHVVITFGGYGTVTGGKVRESFNGMAPAAGDVDWNNIWDFSGDMVNMERMPIFSAIINVENPDVIVVGTEYGVYATDNNGADWTHCSNVAEESVGSLSYVPVFDIRQQVHNNERFMSPENYGVIYAGTHGRGIFRSSDYLNSTADLEDAANANALNVFPNPTQAEAFAQINLDQPINSGAIKVYSVTGALVSNINLGYTARGTHKVALNAEALTAGNYIVVLEANGKSTVGKFIKTN